MTQLKILKFLIEHIYQTFSIRELSKQLNIAYKLVYQHIKKLQEEEIITIETVGKSSQVSFNFNLNSTVYEAEIQRKQEILQNKTIKIIYKELQQIQSPFFIALLFGSYVKKTNTKLSDIDICVIHDNEEIIKKIQSKLNVLPLKIEIHEFTSKEFISMLNTKQFNVGHKIQQYNIILRGIENYYKILENGWEN